MRNGGYAGFGTFAVESHQKYTVNLRGCRVQVFTRWLNVLAVLPLNPPVILR